MWILVTKWFTLFIWQILVCGWSSIMIILRISKTERIFRKLIHEHKISIQYKHNGKKYNELNRTPTGLLRYTSIQATFVLSHCPTILNYRCFFYWPLPCRHRVDLVDFKTLPMTARDRPIWRFKWRHNNFAALIEDGCNGASVVLSGAPIRTNARSSVSWNTSRTSQYVAKNRITNCIFNLIFSMEPINEFTNKSIDWLIDV